MADVFVWMESYRRARWSVEVRHADELKVDDMRRKRLIAVISIVVLALTAALLSTRWFLHQLLISHQQSTTREIAAWGEQYSNIHDPNDAARANEMVEYIRNYYVVSDGYRSNSQADTALENQRRETIERINIALHEYEELSEGSD